MSSLQDLLNPVSSGPSSPVTTRLPSPPPVHKYGLATNTQEAASALVLFADHHHRNSFSLPNNEHDGDRSPVTPIATHHDSSSSDTVSSSPVPPVSPRRVAPMRNSTVHKSSNDFTQILRASSSERDADGDEEDEEMGEDNVKPQGLTDYRLSPTPMVQEGLRSSPPAASASPPPSTVSQNLKDVVTTSITAKSKKRPSAKNVPAKKKGIAKPQKKKRKVDVEEDDLESEIPVRPAASSRKKKSLASNPSHAQVNGQRPASIPPRRETESPPPTKSLPPLPLSPLPKYNAEGMELYCVCRKPDSGKWMIGCDGCEDWFHGECINVAEKDGDLIDKYFCKLHDRASPFIPH
jgi:COMPASS component SPP1